MKMQIKVNWWNDEKREFTEQEQAILKNSGINRAVEMIEDGYTSGELNETLLHFNPSGPATEARGSWEYREANKD